MLYQPIDSCLVQHQLLGFGLPGGSEWVILLVLGLLIFGRRLPDVGRSLGKGIVEFKRGIKGLEDEVEEESSRPTSKRIAEDSPRQELPRSQTMKSQPAQREVQENNPYATVQEQREE